MRANLKKIIGLGYKPYAEELETNIKLDPKNSAVSKKFFCGYKLFEILLLKL